MEPTYHITFPGLGEWATFDINPVAFSIGSFEIRWYGILIAAGALLAMLYAFKNCKRFGINPDKLIDAVIVGFITGIIGARLYYVIFYDFSYYMSHPLSILNLKEGGLAIYGGIIGALLGGLPVIKHHKQNVLAVLDLVVIGFLIGQGIGRWGNFVNQEAYGVATDLPWRMVSEGTGGIGVHPCFLYESLWCLLGVLVLHLVSKKRQYDGQIFLLYLVWGGTFRGGRAPYGQPLHLKPQSITAAGFDHCISRNLLFDSFPQSKKSMGRKTERGKNSLCFRLWKRSFGSG